MECNPKAVAQLFDKPPLSLSSSIHPLPPTPSLPHTCPLSLELAANDLPCRCMLKCTDQITQQPISISLHVEEEG